MWLGMAARERRREELSQADAAEHIAELFRMHSTSVRSSCNPSREHAARRKSPRRLIAVDSQFQKRRESEPRSAVSEPINSQGIAVGEVDADPLQRKQQPDCSRGDTSAAKALAQEALDAAAEMELAQIGMRNPPFGLAVGEPAAFALAFRPAVGDFGHLQGENLDLEFIAGLLVDECAEALYPPTFPAIPASSQASSLAVLRRCAPIRGGPSGRSTVYRCWW